MLNLLTTLAFSAHVQLLKRSCLLSSGGADQDERAPAAWTKLLLLSISNLVAFLANFGLRDQQELLLLAIDCYTALLGTPDALTNDAGAGHGARGLHSSTPQSQQNL